MANEEERMRNELNARRYLQNFLPHLSSLDLVLIIITLIEHRWRLKPRPGERHCKMKKKEPEPG